MIKNNVIQKALSSAKNSQMERGRIGAVLFTNSGYVITFASNVYYDGDSDKRSIHAEEYVLSKMLKISAISRYKKINLLVVRYKMSNNNLAMAKPCINCQKLLKRFPELTVYYSNEKGKICELCI